VAMDRLVEALERNAAAELERLRSDAGAEAARIAAAAVNRIAAHRDETLGALARERRGALELELAEARRASRGRVLESRQHFLDRVFEAAAGLLPGAMSDREYQDTLASRIEEALRCAGDEDATIEVPPELAAFASNFAGRGVRFDIRSGASAGFIVTARGGKVKVDDTLRSRMERARAALAIEVVAAAGPAR
jgi:vacuolar-type H+-ATPase subunit E/Vma4